MFKRMFGFFPLLCATSALAAIEIQDPQVRAMPPGVPNTAGYLTLTSTDRDDALVGAVCEGVKSTELHTLLQEDGMTKMRPVAAIELAAGEAVALTQGGYHLMMMGLSQPLVEGEQLSCELQFRHAEPKPVSLTVTRMGSQDEGHHHHHH